MGHLKDIANQPKIQSFPIANYEIVGLVPDTQCLDAHIYATDGNTQTVPEHVLLDPGAFVHHTLAGDICTIMSSPTGNTGDFTIILNTDNRLDLVEDPGLSANVQYYVHNDSDLIALRNVKSFADFISAAGKAYTIKGGTLYTDINPIMLQDACPKIFNPLT